MDYSGRAIRFTRERLAHVLEHPEMVGMEEAIAETLLAPEFVVQSVSDAQAQLYFRFYYGTRVGNKFLCVVVKILEADAFVVTAYLTNRVKKGRLLWSAKR